MEAELLGDLAPDEAETLRSLLQLVLAHATDDEAPVGSGVRWAARMTARVPTAIEAVSK